MLLAEIASQEVFVPLQGKDNNLYTVIQRPKSESYSVLNNLAESNVYRVEALVSGHPWDTKKVSITGGGRSPESRKTWEKRGFVKAAVSIELYAYKNVH